MSQKILVVDDDPNALRVIHYALSREGFDVLLAKSGPEALKIISEQMVDLVVLDVMMPGMDGYEVCQRLRANPATARLPVLMLTARTQVEDKIRGFKAGADDYLTKPALPAELLARIRALLARSTHVAPPAPEKRAKVITFLGAKGGVGTTTLAVNAGIALVETSKSVVLADLHFGSGAVALQLGLKPSDTFIRLVKETNQRPTMQAVTSCLVSHNTGLKIVPAPVRSEGVNCSVTPARMKLILELLQSETDYLIIDGGASFHPAAVAAVLISNKVAVVTEADYLALDLVKQTVQALEQLNVRGSTVEVVIVNRTRSASVISKTEAEQYLDTQLAAFIIPAPEMCFQANRTHVPIMIAQPGNLTTEQIRQLAERLAG